MRLRITSSTLVFVLSAFLLFGQTKDPVSIANNYLQENVKTLNLTPSDIAGIVVSDLVVSKHNKLTHLYFQQHYRGIPVHNAISNFNISEDGKVLNMGNRFISQIESRVNTTIPLLSMSEALISFIQQLGITDEVNVRILKQESSHTATFDPANLALQPIQVRLTYQPMEDGTVRLAWNIELYELSAQHWWNARVDATNGKVLNSFDQVVHCRFDAPHGNCGAHPVDVKTVSSTPVTSKITLSDGPKYNVYPLTIESPNHGDRAIIENPADQQASPYGWHDSNGVSGAEYTITHGNNVHAYHDIFDINQSSGDEPDGGASLCFDFNLDLSNPFPYTQIDPIVTNLFYWNNLMHDVWHHYGFDEAAGNFQITNYSDQGIGNDEVHAEALDGRTINNANFASPPDGQNPRMQMFLWRGEFAPDPEAILSATAPVDLIGDYEYTQANFGGALPGVGDPPLSGLVVLANDGTGVISDACESLTNGAAIAGNIAMIDQGSCEYGFKCLAAEEAGAIAVVICNSLPNGTTAMGAGAVGDQVTIPAVMISLEDCNTLKMGLPDLSLAFTNIDEFEIPQPGPSGVSGDLDNGVIVHEYTHGISIRLTGGPSQSTCLSNYEQAGEGWSDWFALVMTATPEMTVDQARGIGTYVLDQPVTGVGIRTYPYSSSFDDNPHTYADINNEIAPHGTGSIWCVTIWDLYWNLIDEYGYDENLYTGSGGNNIAMQLVLDGLKLQPCDPTFIEARDAILLADMVNYNGVNQCLIWNTFARRGMGASAIVGGTEAFDLPLSCDLVLNVEKTAVTEAEAGDVITYTLDIFNNKMESVENASITDVLPAGTTFIPGSSNCAVIEDDGILTFNLGDMASGDIIVCTYQVEVSNTPFSYVNFEDDAENSLDNWVFENPVGDVNWEKTTALSNSGNGAFYAQNTYYESDQLLTLKEPIVLNGEHPAIVFWHYYDTDSKDGGVVEVTIEDGNYWIDLGYDMIENGYSDWLGVNSSSPLGGRHAFSGKSHGWIRTVIDLTNFATLPIKVRWRLGCDGQIGGDGWYIDDIRFYDNFRQITNIACTNDETSICSEASTVIVGDPATRTTAIDNSEALFIFPNPTEGNFTIQLANGMPKAAELRVFTKDSRLLTRMKEDNFQSIAIDLSTHGAGVYFIQLITDKGTTIKRVVVK